MRNHDCDGSLSGFDFIAEVKELRRASRQVFFFLPSLSSLFLSLPYHHAHLFSEVCPSPSHASLIATPPSAQRKPSKQ
jgi:hypothetical protein